MKRNIVVLGLTLTLLLIGLSGISSDGRIRTGDKSKQNNAKQTESSTQGNEEKMPLYDIYGKRLRANEKYIAAMAPPNGRTIAYRKNNREIAALVKALKRDGVTDEKLLDSRSWSTAYCWKINDSCFNAGCTVCKAQKYIIERTPGSRINTLFYCGCSQ
jgi:hypothetical protein